MSFVGPFSRTGGGFQANASGAAGRRFELESSTNLINGRTDAFRNLPSNSPSMELPTSETTLAEVLKRAGYATAHFGKRHMGRTSPSQHGFDEKDGANGNGGPDNIANPHPKQLFTDRQPTRQPI